METNPGARFLGLARLNDEQLAELSALERDLGAVIIALKPTLPFAKLMEQRQGIIALACQE